VALRAALQALRAASLADTARTRAPSAAA